MYILWGVHTTTFSKINRYSVIIHFYRTMCAWSCNFQRKKLKVKIDDLIAKITNIHLCRMGSDRKYSSIPIELLLGANSIIYLYEHIYISALWGVTENTKVFPLEYCIMYTIFGYLIIISNKVCPSFCWIYFHPKSVPFPVE